MREDEARTFPQPEVQQPDPMMDEQPVGWFRVTLTTIGAAAVLILVMYGLSRPPEQPQMAAAEPNATAPAGGGAANNAGGKAQPANAPAQNPQTNAQKPTTTGQGSGDKGSGDKGGSKPGTGQAGASKTPPAAGSSADSTVGPGAKQAPQPK
jgi:hypothetical protein